MIMRFIGRTFGRGLIVVLPAVVTVFLLWWLFAKVESLVVMVLVGLGVPREEIVPGIGVVLVVVIVFVMGLLMKAALAQQLYRGFESLLGRVPLVKSLYGSIRDLMGFFSGEQKQGLGRVVMVDLNGDGRQRLIGFLTRDTFEDMPEGVGSDQHVAVYLPMSYQLGGFTTIVPRDAVQSVDMPIEQAMRFALTAGVKQDDNDGDGHAKSPSTPQAPTTDVSPSNQPPTPGR